MVMGPGPQKDSAIKRLVLTFVTGPDDFRGDSRLRGILDLEFPMLGSTFVVSEDRTLNSSTWESNSTHVVNFSMDETPAKVPHLEALTLVFKSGGGGFFGDVDRDNWDLNAFQVTAEFVDPAVAPFIIFQFLGPGRFHRFKANSGREKRVEFPATFEPAYA